MFPIYKREKIKIYIYPTRLLSNSIPRLECNECLKFKDYFDNNKLK